MRSQNIVFYITIEWFEFFFKNLLNVQYDLKTQGLNILTIVSYNRDMSIHGCAEQLLSSIYGMYLGCITLIQPYTILYANNSNLTFVFCCRWDRNIVVARETSNWGQSG